MKQHYNIQPIAWHAKPMVFDWDSETGEISGESAADIIRIASYGAVPCHPCPAWPHSLSAYPLKSREDMAAIIGWEHQLPDDMARYYPSIDGQDIPETSQMKDGIYEIGADKLVF